MKKRIWLCLYAFLLLCTASFAWILGGEPHKVPYVSIDYQENANLTVSSIESLTAEIFFQDAQGNRFKVDNVDDFVLDPKNFVPNTIVPFTISLKNTSVNNIEVNLSIAELVVSDPAFLDVVFISMSGGSGYTDGTVKPIYSRLSEATSLWDEENLSYSLPLYSGENTLIVPGNRTVELDGYLYFDRNADIQYQNMSLQIKVFRLEQ